MTLLVMVTLAFSLVSGPDGEITLAVAEATASDSLGAAPQLVLRASAPTSHESISFQIDPMADDWFGRDKLLHFGTSFLLTLSSQYFLTEKVGLDETRGAFVSAPIALSLGLMKELGDARHPTRPYFSWRDMVANSAGVLLAVGLIAL